MRIIEFFDISVYNGIYLKISQLRQLPCLRAFHWDLTILEEIGRLSRPGVAPEHGWLEDEFPFFGLKGLFSGAMLVFSFREGNSIPLSPWKLKAGHPKIIYTHPHRQKEIPLPNHHFCGPAAFENSISPTEHAKTGQRRRTANKKIC